MVRQKATMVAAVLGLGLTAGLASGAAAQQFQMVSDGQDGVWVLDDASGAVSWCRLVTPPGAKLVDVFGADAQVRDARTLPARPECEQVRGPSPDAAGLGEVLAQFEADGGYDGDAVYAPWWGRTFGWRRQPGDVGGGSHRGDVGVR